MKTRTLTALLIIALLYLWGRLQDETARADANAEKAKERDTLSAAFSEAHQSLRRSLDARLTPEEQRERKLRIAEREAINNA